MRLQLKIAWPKHPYKIQLPETVVIVRQKGHTLSWIWTDGIEYSVEYPYYRIGRKPRWQVFIAEELISSGVMLHPTFHDTFLRTALPYIEWNLDGDIIREEPGYCGGTLRLSTGRRLAQWRIRRRVNIVCRDNHPTCHVPFILAMILARVYDPN